MKTMVSILKRRFVLNSLSSFYRSESYDLILKHLRKPFSMKRDTEVICNIFRIIALKETSQEIWKDEYDYLYTENFLNVFGDDEQSHLKTHLSFRLFGIKELSAKHNSINVSKRLKKYFPIEILANEFQD